MSRTVHPRFGGLQPVVLPGLEGLHYNYTGAYIGGLEASGTHYLAAANLYRSEFGSDQGIMVYAVDKQTRAVTKYQLAAGGSYSCPQMMKFSNDKLLVLWEDKSNENNTIYYSFLDGTGKPTGTVKTAQGRLSDCKPILAGGKAVWYVTGDYLDAAPTFYVMDANGNLSVNAGAVGSDRLPSAWAKAQVDEAISLGLVPGFLQDYYTTSSYRSAFCDLADALYTKTVPTPITATVKFGDTNDSAVERMATVGVVNGVGNNLFDPMSDLTREQAATMLYRLAAAAGKPLPDVSASFADKNSISSWASKEVGAVQAAGIMNGVGNNRFDPKGSYTTEQSIVTMLRMYRYLNQ